MSRVLVLGAAAPSARALALADLVELRLDLGAAAHAEALAARAREGRPPRVLVTLRSVAEGGRFAGSPTEAAGVLAAAAAAHGAAWVDAEAEVVAPLRARLGPGPAVLASQHHDGAVALPTDGVSAWKVARRVDDGPALRRALDEAAALARAHVARRVPPATVVPYGRLAAARVLTAAAARGAGVDPFVFGTDAEGGDGAALPGVPTLASLVEDGRLDEVSGAATAFALLGRPPATSPSARLHNAVFRALGLDAAYLGAVDLEPDAALALPLAGASVTTPWKVAVAARCHHLDPRAARVGAVNTVRRDTAGRWHGGNTDADAVAAALARHGVRAGGALVVGGGGFARAAAVALAEAGLTVRLAGSARAAAAAAALGVGAAGPDAPVHAGDRVVVNATPVGADGVCPDAWRARLAAAGAGVLVVDAPYAPGGAPGAVACAARARGLAAVDGGELLVLQAAGQVAAFTGRPPPPGVLEANLRPARALALVGPRGAGKTTVGRLVAARLGWAFVDTDDALARRAGRPAGRVLAREGEPAFRARERDVATAALARRGVVVALGGGALTGAEVAAAAARAFAVALDVAPGTAAARVAADPTPRPPLLPGTDPVEEARRVAAARAGAVAAVAAARVATDGRSPDEVADAVVAAWVGAGEARFRLD